MTILNQQRALLQHSVTTLKFDFPASFSLFMSFQYIVNSKFYLEFADDSNRGILVSEATALPT